MFNFIVQNLLLSTFKFIYGVLYLILFFKIYCYTYTFKFIYGVLFLILLFKIYIYFEGGSYIFKF